MDGLIPWQLWRSVSARITLKLVEGVSHMTRVPDVQLFYNLSDPGMEDLLYEAESVRRFVGLRLSEALPAATILHFRHILEHELGETV